MKISVTISKMTTMYTIRNDIRRRASFIIKNNSFPLKVRRMVRVQVEAKFKQINATQSDYGLKGLDKVLDSSKAVALRLAWGLLLIGCLAVCSYQIYVRFAYYYSEPVAVNVKIVEWDKLEFPSMSISNLDQHGLMAMHREANFSDMEFQDCFSPVLSLLKLANGKDVNRIWASLNSTKTFVEIKILMRHRQPYEVKLTEEYAFTGMFTKLDIDERFPYGGMGTMLVVHFVNPTGTCNSSNIAGTVQPLGMPSEIRNAWSFLGVTSIDFMCTLKKYEFVSSRNEPCTDLQTFLQCQKSCRINHYKKLPCRFPFMPEELSLPLCTVTNETKNLFAQAVKIGMRASCTCTRSCQQTTYNAGINFIQVNSRRETIFRVYYEHNRIITITERFAYDFISLLSDTGGNLGLCLGLSILSIFQIFQGLIGKFTPYLKNKKPFSKPLAKFNADPVFRQVTRILQEEFQRYKYENLKRGLVSSSITGLSTVLDSAAPPIWRLVWLLVILGSLGLCCFFVHIRLAFYMSDPTHMTMKIGKEDIVHFPNVTICGYTYDVIKVMRGYAKMKRIIRKLSLNRAMYDWCPVKLLNLLELSRVSPEMIWKLSSVEKQLNFSLDYGEMLLGFSIATTFHSHVVDLPEGRCVQHDIGNQVFLGSNTQFTRITYDKVWKTFAEEMMACDRNYYTAYFTPPNASFHMNTQVIYPFGATTIVPVEYQKITLLNRAINPCATTDEANECDKSCFHKIFLRSKIPCRLPYMPTTTNLTTCTKAPLALEAEAIYKDLALRFDSLLHKDCGCIRRCDKTIMFFVPYSEPQPYNITVFGISFFTNIQQHLMEEHSDSLSSVICAIGGNLGLALGVSLLSLFDMLQSFISAVFKHIFPKHTGNRHKLPPITKTRQIYVRKIILGNKFPLYPKINLEYALK